MWVKRKSKQQHELISIGLHVVCLRNETTGLTSVYAIHGKLSTEMKVGSKYLLKVNHEHNQITGIKEIAK